MVLIYEAIEASLLPFNTVPQWMMAMDSAGRSQKIWLKIAQEGVNFLNDLCKKGYVHMLRVMTEDGWTQNAYRCSKQGEEFLNTVPDKLKSQCDGVVTDHIDGQSKEVIIGTDPDHHVCIDCTLGLKLARRPQPGFPEARRVSMTPPCYYS